jgi:hypothetical protein
VSGRHGKGCSLTDGTVAERQMCGGQGAVSSLGALRRDQDWDLPQKAAQAAANVFLVMAEVGQEGAECVMDKDQFVMCEFKSGHAKRFLFSSHAGPGRKS